MKRRMYVCIIMVCMTVLMAGGVVNAQTVKEITVNLSGVRSVGKEIQKALDEALADTTGEVRYEINLPAGTYKLDTLLKVYSNTTIHMNGCKLVRTENKTMLRIGQEETSYSGYGGQHDIMIEGGTFDGGGTKEKVTASMIRMGHGKNLSFQNMTFQNVYKTHHVELAGCSDVLFDNCTFKDFYSNGSVANAANNEALQFDVIHNATHFPKYPGFDDTPCQNITVTNCSFSNLQRGLGTHSAVAGSYFENMVFKNNTFTNVKGYAIVGTNYRNSIISGNRINKCGAGILFRSMVQGYNNFYEPLKGTVQIQRNAASVIENNTITVSDYKYKTTAYGISLYGEKLKKKKKDAPAGDYTLCGVTVSGNTITMNNSGYGIWLQGTNDSKVSHNKVTMNIKASVSGKGNSDCIRLVGSKNNTIDANTLAQKKKNKRTASACGIVLTTNASADITNNKITNSPKDGIFVITKSKAVVSKNTIKKTGRHGINVCDKSTVTMKGNKISGYKGKITNTYSGGKIKKK